MLPDDLAEAQMAMIWLTFEIEIDDSPLRLPTAASQPVSWWWCCSLSLVYVYRWEAPHLETTSAHSSLSTFSSSFPCLTLWLKRTSKSGGGKKVAAAKNT